MFEMTERETGIVRSVTLGHKDLGGLPHSRQIVDPLGQPRRTGLPPPHSAFITEWLRNQFGDATTTEPTAAKLYVFENTKSAKALEVFAWTARKWGTLYHAYLLRVVDI